MAVGSIYNDGVYRYTVLTESGNTGTVSIGAFTTESVVGNVTLPEKYISGSVVYDVTRIESGVNAGEGFSYSKNLTGITIPDQITSFYGRNNFDHASKLKYVILSKNIKTLDYYTFRNCFSLSKINLLNVKTINQSCFIHDSSLKEVNIPDTVTTFGTYPFNDCSNLRRLYIGIGLTTMSNLSTQFTDCSKIEEVYVDSQYVVDHFHEIFPQITSSSSPLRYVEIGDSVTSIGTDAFVTGSSLIEVKIGKNVQSIGERAFRGCNNLKYINIPDSVNTIDSQAFYGGSPGYKCTIPESVTNFQSNGQFTTTNKVLYINCKAKASIFTSSCFSFFYHVARTKLFINTNTVNTIDSNCFNNSVCLYDLRFPASIQTINAYAFYSMYSSGNPQCYSITFEGNCPITGSYIFNDNYYSNLKIYYYENTNGWTSQFGNKNIPTQQVFRGYYTSGNFTYKFTDGHDNRPNVSVRVADGIKLSGEVTIPGKITIKGLDYYVRSIEEEGFKDQYKITSITFDSNAVGLLDIGKNAFKGCSKLESISNTSTLLDIFEGAFDGCSSLSSFTIPNTVYYLFKNTFRNCKNLKTCTLSSNIYVIEENCFQNCESLQSINIPNNIDRIQNNTFANCTHLTTVTYGTGLEDIFESAFTNCKNLSSFTANSTNNLKRIRDKAFYNCYALTTPPISVATQIGEYCFYNNRSLTSLTLPSTIDYIKDYAFGNCVNLTTLTNDTNQYADFGNNVFLNCKVTL